MSALWQATTALAETLRPSAPLNRFASTLGGQPQRADSQLPSHLNWIFASFGNLRAQPFLLSMRLGQIPGSNVISADPAGQEFYRDSVAVAAAMIAIIEWLRAGLPRYPIRFKLPYTDPHSSRVIDDGFADAHRPWLLEARRRGFQAQTSVAPIVAKALVLEEAPVRAALADLRDELHESAQWRRFGTAAKAVTASDEAELGAVLDIFRREARPEAINAVEPNRVHRRMQHRHAALRLAEREAEAHGGRIAEYYASFRGVDRILGGIISLATQLMTLGPPKNLAITRVAWRRDATDYRTEVSATTTGVWLHLNEVVELKVALTSLSGLVVVEGVHITVVQGIEDVRVNGVLLPGSA